MSEFEKYNNALTEANISLSNTLGVLVKRLEGVDVAVEKQGCSVGRVDYCV